MDQGIFRIALPDHVHRRQNAFGMVENEGAEGCARMMRVRGQPPHTPSPRHIQGQLDPATQKKFLRRSNQLQHNPPFQPPPPSPGAMEQSLRLQLGKLWNADFVVCCFIRKGVRVGDGSRDFQRDRKSSARPASRQFATSHAKNVAIVQI